MRDLAALPKGHLHLHLEGAMRPETLAELADTYGVEVPPIRGFGSFSAFAGMYLAACAVLRTPDDLARVAREVVRDAAEDGAVWVEPAFYPDHHLGLGTSGEVLDIVREAVLAEGAECGIGVGLMVASDRTVDPAQAEHLATLAVERADRGVVAFGLANDESLWPPGPFAGAFRIARDGGLLSTPHAGELAGPQSVIDALDLLGAHRIQHGIRAIEDPALLQRLADSGVCLDVCPTSNVLLSVVPSLAQHPLPALLAAGIRCSVNSDDPLLFGPDLLDEYEICRTDLGLSDEAIASIARSSLECSGAPRSLVAQGVTGIAAWLAS